MPLYDVTDKRTGRQLTLRGDRPPTPQELESIFAAQGQPEPSGFWDKAEKAIDIATAFGSFYPPTAIASRLVQGGLALKNLATGSPGQAAFNLLPAIFGRPAIFGSKGRAAKGLINTATKGSARLTADEAAQALRPLTSTPALAKESQVVASALKSNLGQPRDLAPNLIRQTAARPTPTLQVVPPPVASQATAQTINTATPRELARLIQENDVLDRGLVGQLRNMVGAEKAARLLSYVPKGSKAPKTIGGFKVTPDMVREIAGGTRRPPLPATNLDLKKNFLNDIRAEPPIAANPFKFHQPEGGTSLGSGFGGVADQFAKHPGVGLGAVGGTLEALSADNPQDALARGAVGALGGAVAGSAIGRGVGGLSREIARRGKLAGGFADDLASAKAARVPMPSPERLATALKATNPRGVLRAEDGFGAVKMVSALGGGSVGALGGAAQGETTEDRIMNAVVFGALGAAGGVMATNLLAASGAPVPGLKKLFEEVGATMPGAKDRGVKAFINKYRYFSMLSSPLTIMKMLGGTHSAMYATAVDLMAQGKARQGARLLKEYYKINFAENGFYHAMKDPKAWEQFFPGAKFGRGTELFQRQLEEKGILTLPGRIARAFDAVAMKAGDRARLDPDTLQALRTFMLAGQPTSRLGNDAVKMATKSFPLSMLVPFPRVAVQSLERGFEFSPLTLLGGKRVANFARQGFTKNAAGQMERAAQLTNAQARARGAFGTAAGIAGGALGATGEVDKKTAFFGSAFAGPAALTALIGFVIGDALQQGKVPAAMLDDIINQLSYEMPIPDVNAIERLVRGEFLVPGAVGFAADITDPVERDTRGGFFNPTLRRIPGVRESLPPRLNTR